MNKKDIEKLVLIVLALVAILVVVFVGISMLSPVKRSNKADKVDFSCITEPKANPLKECKK